MLKSEAFLCQTPCKEHSCSYTRPVLSYKLYKRINLEHFWESTKYVTSLTIAFHIPKSAKQDEIKHTTFKPPVLNYRLVLSNCVKYTFQLVGWVVKLHRSLIGRQNVRQCFSLATYGVYKLLYTQPNIFKYIHTSCIHPCKPNYPHMLRFTSTLSNLPRYLKLLRNYADKDEEVDLKLQRKSFIPLLLQNSLRVH